MSRSSVKSRRGVMWVKSLDWSEVKPMVRRNPSHPEKLPDMLRQTSSTAMDRRAALKGIATAIAAFALTSPAGAQEAAPAPYKAKNGRIRQSVVPWCFKPMPFDELARHSAALGLGSVELCPPKEWLKLKELGL